MTKGKSLASFFIIPLIIGLLILVGVSASLYYLGIQDPLEKQAKQLLASRTAERANLIQQRVQQIQMSLDLAAQSVFSEDDNEVIDKLKKQVPRVDQVVVFDDADIQPQDNATPAITHVVVDLLRKTEQGNTPPPELILQNGNPSYIAFTEKLADERLVLATVSLEQIQGLLGKADDQSRLELRQKFSGTSHVVAFVGNEPAQGNPLVESGSFGANWSLALWQRVGAFSTDAGKLPLLLFIAAVMAFLIVGLLPLLSMKRLFSSDARRFIKEVKSNSINSRKYQLNFFKELAASYSRVSGVSNGVSGELDDVDEAKSKNKGKRRARPLINPETLEKEGADTEDTGTNEVEDEGLEPIPESSSEPQVLEFTTSKADSPKDVNEDEVSQNIRPEIFREYDIRGVMGISLNYETVYVIGKAIGSEAYSRGEQSVIVGRDGRLSSPELHKALIDGLLASGRDVIDLGLVPTPLVYFGTHTLGSRSGVMLTGSHNPPEHNGLKVVLAGETLFGKDIQDLLQRIQMQEFFNGKGRLKETTIEKDYLAKLLDDISLDKPLKVAVDCGNGATGDFAPKMLQALGCDVIGLYTDIDGNFPNHHPDPNSANNLKALIKMVTSEKADIGLAFDGDGDRLGVIDNKGKIIWTDRLMMLFAQDVLSRNAGAEIVYDVKCTRFLKDVVEQAGGKPVMWKTGHSLMKAKMRETEAPFGGEGSGHLYFNERWFGFDDALYAAARLLEMLSKADSTASEVFEELPEGLTSEEINVPVPDKLKFKLIKALVKKGDFGDGDVTTIDGLRVDYKHRWLLARASNTTPSIVVKFEADNKASLDAVKNVLREQLLKIAPKLKLNF
ncbi:phosphomannomutase/phosphoglucomutase [Kangiella marina]|uniref:phosphomannomutase n=1 Tax=Kangiella marina TaxID=1079178 RepID=A0ABP8IGN5_9GAMM